MSLALKWPFKASILLLNLLSETLGIQFFYFKNSIAFQSWFCNYFMYFVIILCIFSGIIFGKPVQPGSSMDFCSVLCCFCQLSTAITGPSSSFLCFLLVASWISKFKLQTCLGCWIHGYEFSEETFSLPGTQLLCVDPWVSLVHYFPNAIALGGL